MKLESKFFSEGGKCFKWIFRPFITTRDGRRIYRPNGKMFRFPVEVDCTSCDDCK